MPKVVSRSATENAAKALRAIAKLVGHSFGDFLGHPRLERFVLFEGHRHLAGLRAFILSGDVNLSRNPRSDP